MVASKVELVDAEDGSLLALSWGRDHYFGIKSTIGDEAKITLLAPKLDKLAGPLTLTSDKNFKFVDLGTKWILDFDPKTIVLKHGGMPDFGSLLITENGLAILCNVYEVGWRFLLANGKIIDGDRDLPYVAEWSILMPTHSDHFRKVFSWPPPGDD